MAYNRWLREGVTPVRSTHLPANNFWRKYFNIGKNGQFIKGTIPGISLPSIAPHTEATDPSTFADAYIIAHKKGGKVKKCQLGDQVWNPFNQGGIPFSSINSLLVKVVGNNSAATNATGAISGGNMPAGTTDQAGAVPQTVGTASSETTKSTPTAPTPQPVQGAATTGATDQGAAQQTAGTVATNSAQTVQQPSKAVPTQTQSGTQPQQNVKTSQQEEQNAAGTVDEELDRSNDETSDVEAETSGETRDEIKTSGETGGETKFNTITGGPSFGETLLKYANPELAGNFANFAMSLSANKMQADSDIKGARLAAQQEWLNNQVARKNAPIYDQSALDRGLEQNKRLIYNQPTMSGTDPNSNRQHRLQQTQMAMQANNQYNDAVSAQQSAYKKSVEDTVQSNFAEDFKSAKLAQSLGKGIEYADNKTKTAQKLANTQSAINLITDLSKRAQTVIDKARNIVNLANQYNAEIGLYNDAVAEWDKLVKSGQIDEDTAKKYGSDILSYFQTNKPEWYTNTSAKYRGDALQNSIGNGFLSSLVKIPNMKSRNTPTAPAAASVMTGKKGGKLSINDRL